MMAGSCCAGRCGRTEEAPLNVHDFGYTMLHSKQRAWRKITIKKIILYRSKSAHEATTYREAPMCALWVHLQLCQQHFLVQFHAPGCRRDRDSARMATGWLAGSMRDSAVVIHQKHTCMPQRPPARLVWAQWTGSKGPLT